MELTKQERERFAAVIVALKDAIGCAQEGIVPSIYRLNRWRKSIGWHELERLPTEPEPSDE